jgi:hypothetical protein
MQWLYFMGESGCPFVDAAEARGAKAGAIHKSLISFIVVLAPTEVQRTSTSDM